MDFVRERELKNYTVTINSLGTLFWSLRYVFMEARTHRDGEGEGEGYGMRKEVAGDGGIGIVMGLVKGHLDS